MRKARLLTLEEIKKDHLGAHVYEETRGEERLRLLIKIGMNGKFVTEEGEIAVPLCFGNSGMKSGITRFWRGMPSMTLRRETPWT